MKQIIIGLAVLFMSIGAMAENPLLGHWSFERYDCEGDAVLSEHFQSRGYTKENVNVRITFSEKSIEMVRFKENCTERYTENYSVDGTVLSRTVTHFSNEGVCSTVPVRTGKSNSHKFAVAGEELYFYGSSGGGACDREDSRFMMVFKKQS